MSPFVEAEGRGGTHPNQNLMCSVSHALRAMIPRAPTAWLLACVAAAATCDVAMSATVPASANAGVYSVPTPALEQAPKLRGSVQQVLAEIAEVTAAADGTVDSDERLDGVVPVRFSLQTTPDVEDVFVVGSWTDWQGPSKLMRQGDDGFEGWIDVPTGTHQFKFITDGKWITSSEFPTELDQAGNSNNILSVAATQRSASQATEAPDREADRTLNKRLETVRRHPQPAALAPRNSGVGNLAKAVFAPFRFASHVLLAPLRALLRLLGLM